MRALRTALQHAALRRLLLAFVVVSLGTWALAILVSLYAYAEGGAIAVGVAVVVRTLPAAVVVPSVAMLADRHSRRMVLVVSAGAQGLAVGAVALAVALAAPFTVVLALAAMFMVAGGASNPARAALIPELAETPTEMAAANVAWESLDYAAFLVGSATAGALAASAGLAAGIALCTLAFVAAVVVLIRLPRDRRPDYPGTVGVVGAIAELTAGLRTIWSHRDMGLLTSVSAASVLVQGIVDVLLVVASFECWDSETVEWDG